MTVRKAHEDFDAFWAKHQASAKREQVKIRSRLVDIPTDVPLRLQMQAENTDLMDEGEVRTMIGEFFGVGTLDAWIGDGMGARELAVVLAWATLRAGGKDVTFAEAAEAMEAQLSGKAPASNRAQRRATTKKTTPTSSGRTGASSSPTSAASTRSARKR